MDAFAAAARQAAIVCVFACVRAEAHTCSRVAVARCAADIEAGAVDGGRRCASRFVGVL